ARRCRAGWERGKNRRRGRGGEHKVWQTSSPHVWLSAAQCVAPSSQQCAQALRVAVFRYPVVWAVPTWAVPSSTVKVVCHCTPCAPTSTSVNSKPRPLTAALASKYGSTKATTPIKNWLHRKPLLHPAAAVDVVDAVDHAVVAVVPHRVPAQAHKEAKANAYPTSRKISQTAPSRP